MLRVIDDFLGDPYTFRNEGLKLYNKEAKRSLDSRFKHSAWPGLRCFVPDFLCKKYVSQVESIVDNKLTLLEHLTNKTCDEMEYDQFFIELLNCDSYVEILEKIP